MKNSTTERSGEIIMLTEAILFAFFPIILAHTTKLMPPLLFAGVSIFIAGLPLFVYQIYKGQLSILKNKKFLKYILGIIIFIIIIPSALIFTGTSMTSGINTTILLQTEIFFALIVCGLFTKEQITTQKIIGSSLIAIGAITILYDGSFQLNIGDILIIAGAFFYPIGNIFSKKALKITNSINIISLRSIIGGPILIIFSLLFETYSQTPTSYITSNIAFILVNGLVIYLISKILWYEGLRRLAITKATALAMSYPAFSLVFAFLFLKEIPSLYQWIGFTVCLAGVYIAIRQKKAAASHYV